MLKPFQMKVAAMQKPWVKAKKGVGDDKETVYRRNEARERWILVVICRPEEN